MTIESNSNGATLKHLETEFTECGFLMEDVLVKDAGLESLFEPAAGESQEVYQEKVKAALADDGRMLVTLEQLKSLRAQFDIRLGLVSRHGEAWIDAVLNACWPGFEWDFLVDDEGKTRFGRGMWEFNGDTWGVWVCSNAAQVASCYGIKNAFPVLATWSWDCVPGVRGGAASRECWHEVSALADAQIDAFSELADVLEDPVSELPILERLLMSSKKSVESPRLLQCKKFGPSGSGLEFVAYGLGRYFPWNCEQRRDWPLSRSILEMKEASVFPKEWLLATSVAVHDMQDCAKNAPLIVTTVPARPGRVARLTAFLKQLEASGLLSDCNAAFVPDLFGFQEGVLSNHHDKLGLVDRYINIRDHLYVKQPELLRSHPNVVVIDDVVTTGATLCFAKCLLHKAGVEMVMPLAMALTISQR